jgi:hypothetical protein
MNRKINRTSEETIMTYKHQSNNPYITSLMLEQGLYMVSVTRAPNCYEEYQKHSGQLLIDNSRKKLLYVVGCDKIIIDINLADIQSILPLEENIWDNSGHRKKVVQDIIVNVSNKNGYRFHIDLAFCNDVPLFLDRLQRQIKYVHTPSVEKRDKRIGTVFALLGTILFFLWTIIDWTNGGSIGLGFFTLFSSIVCGGRAYFGFKDWN